MDDVSSHIHERSSGRYILLSLAIIRSVVAPPFIVTGLLLIEISVTFGVPVGIAGQITTASSVVGIFFALLMSVLSIRYDHKLLLVAGVLSYCISAVGCSFAPNFQMMLLAYSLTGLGFTTVASMVTTLIGEMLSVEKRTQAIGWSIACVSIVYLIGTLVTNFLVGFGGWRMVFIGFVTPMSLLSFLLASRGVPSTSSKHHPTSRTSYVQGFQAVLSNRSAMACLVETAISMATWSASLVYNASFYRQRFDVSIDFVTLTTIVGSLCYISGSLLCGRLANRFGRKQLTVFTAFFIGVFAIIATNVPHLGLSSAFNFLLGLFAGILVTAFSSLTLEQVPRFRGMMMSLSSAAMSMGQMTGGAVGGLLVILFNYGVLGIWQGVIAIISASIFYLFARDPTIPLR